jgi:hypothetical protein
MRIIAFSEPEYWTPRPCRGSIAQQTKSDSVPLLSIESNSLRRVLSSRRATAFLTERRATRHRGVSCSPTRPGDRYGPDEGHGECLEEEGEAGARAYGTLSRRTWGSGQWRQSTRACGKVWCRQKGKRRGPTSVCRGSGSLPQSSQRRKLHAGRDERMASQGEQKD